MSRDTAPPEKRKRMKRLAAGSALLVTGVAGGGILAGSLTASASSPSTASPTTSVPTSGSNGSNGSAGSKGFPDFGHQFGPGQHGPGDHGPFAGLGDRGTVTAVGATTVTIKTTTGTTTYAVNASSQIDKNGKSTLAKLAVGDTVIFSTTTSGSTKTITRLFAGDPSLHPTFGNHSPGDHGPGDHGPGRGGAPGGSFGSGGSFGGGGSFGSGGPTEAA